MSRAFVKEDDGELTSYRDDEKHVRKTMEWLRLQEKKLDVLRNDPKGQAIAPEKREKWIRELEVSIAEIKAELGSLAS